MEISKIITELEKHRNKVGKCRDDLREKIADFKSLKETCERAYDDIQSAIDALSEQA